MKILQKVEARVLSFYFINPKNVRRATIARSNDSTIIKVIHPICCGLDVHKEKVSACILFTGSDGEVESEVCEFSTFTDDLMQLRDWLSEYNCPIVAMERTGIYWRLVYNVLEEHFKVVLVNARDVKNLPGRKTDIGDSKWLTGLLRHGLIRGIFIPPKQIRQLRDLTRLRKKYIDSLSDYKRRAHMKKNKSLRVLKLKKETEPLDFALTHERKE